MARALPALRGFVHASSRYDFCITAAIIPGLLAPAIVLGSTNPKRTQGLKYQGSIRHASVTASPQLTENSVDGHVYSKYRLPLEVERLMSSPHRRSPSHWVTAIESYLPPNLRLGGENVTGERLHNEPLRPIHTLPETLSLARSSCKADLLSYIGVYQERWEAVIWLVKAMMRKYPGHREMERMSCRLPQLLWMNAERNLDEVTEHPIRAALPLTLEFSQEYNQWHSGVAFDQYPWSHKSNHRDDLHILARKSLGQIWQSLGAMILQAADQLAADSSYSMIMSHVFQILGYLHRINAFPDSIYNYTPPKDPTVIQRPPTLHLLSKRIMSTLSDVEWGLQWEETIKQALSQGYELPKASVQPKIREFGPELWLDLVLWACIEGGWVSEGAWIVTQIQRRMAIKDVRWSTISWSEICERKAPKLDWTSILRLEIDKTRLNQVGGIGIATGTNSHVEMGIRTLSREVVLALMDGLLNHPQSTAGDFGMTTLELRRSIIACKSLLDCNHSELDSKFMDAAILRIFESCENIQKQPGLLSRFLDLRSTELKQTTINSGTRIPAQDQGIDDSAAFLGLQHRILHRFSIDGNQEESLRTFRKIQRTVDSQREGRILAFAHELRERPGRDDDVSYLIGDREDYAALTQPCQVPVRALAAFVDLITNSRLFDLGNWLLMNNDIDGGLVDPALYTDENLQPALLRFGTATSNDRLLIKILERLETPLSEPIIHALLHFQAALGKWTAVEELLEYMRNTSDMAWEPSDVASIAKAILQMEREPPDNADADSISRALAIVQDLVNGRYNPKADPSQLMLHFSRIKVANQLGRILQTLPGSLSKITTRLPGEDMRAHASADIEPATFNMILEPIVDRDGSRAGKELWDRWCRVSTTEKREQKPRSFLGDGERVVTPTLHILRTVLRPVLETRRALRAALKDERMRTQGAKKATSADPEDPSFVPLDEKFRLGDADQAIVDWGVTMYKKFGMSEVEINREIPGAFRQRQRAKPVQDWNDVDS